MFVNQSAPNLGKSQSVTHVSGIKCHLCLKNRPKEFGAPGEIRTPDRLVRSQVLYPAELRAREAAIIQKDRCKSGVLPELPGGNSSGVRRPLQQAEDSDWGLASAKHKWRRERDSNPRYAFGVYTLSRGAPSTNSAISPESNAPQEYPLAGEP